METKKRDLIISGAGKTVGGSYNDVKISGSGLIDGDIECNTFSSSGAGNIRGNIKSDFVKISGASKIGGDVNCKEIKVSGSTIVIGTLNADRIGISGVIKIGKNVTTESIKISGALKIDGDCECECFESSGKFKILGLLNSETIDMTIGGKCKVKEIGCQKIRVKKDESGGFSKIMKALFAEKYYLITDIIEGDEIYLENTIAQVVRGNNVVIGSGCDIQIIEYHDSISIDDKSKVIEISQV
ncbi:polymer-forming cytoskeletal [Clostridium tepidiprofundi DSM 19306]|uniref:Polymer-forming cytoskeletal n=1 Tax=Clostridium tepidiprofundi DSM 19306 TaxID=1121338 RepID=A0A151B678_9CLOT|nr:polymer-forming cytoskeletal protein [Clostridium tepidiprofundi]KYH35252.1 polymer-forming cytoskeletal [Clostridium tepidiprofundi DSM 19306]